MPGARPTSLVAPADERLRPDKRSTKATARLYRWRRRDSIGPTWPRARAWSVPRLPIGTGDRPSSDSRTRVHPSEGTGWKTLLLGALGAGGRGPGKQRRPYVTHDAPTARQRQPPALGRFNWTGHALRRLSGSVPPYLRGSAWLTAWTRGTHFLGDWMATNVCRATALPAVVYALPQHDPHVPGRAQRDVFFT